MEPKVSQNEPKEECLTENRLSCYFSVLVSLTLFIGGLILLSLRIPGWSLFLGLPSIQVGIIFLIFSLDQLARRKAGVQSLQILECSICRQPTITPKWKKEVICDNCEKEVAKKVLRQRG